MVTLLLLALVVIGLIIVGILMNIDSNLCKLARFIEGRFRDGS